MTLSTLQYILWTGKSYSRAAQKFPHFSATLQ